VGQNAFWYFSSSNYFLFGPRDKQFWQPSRSRKFSPLVRNQALGPSAARRQSANFVDKMF
jgi:hypothetical protein